MIRITPLAPIASVAIVVTFVSAVLADSMVVFTVRGPDGRPAADAVLEIASSDRHLPLRESRTATVTADTSGMVRLPWAAGTARLRVTWPHVGFGATDPFDVPATGVVEVAMPPLVPFGSIRGVLPDQFRGANLTLDPQAYSAHRRTVNELKVAADGQFKIDDLIPGRYILQPKSVAGPLGIVAFVVVFPGEETAQVTFCPDPFQARGPRRASLPIAEAAKAELPQTSSPFVWFAGTVRDVQGQPVRRATVFVSGEHNDVIRVTEVVLSTQTDEQGRWEIRDNDRQHQLIGNSKLVVYQSGHPPGVTTVRGRNDSFNQKPLEAAEEYDLVLPVGGCGLNVRVLQAGHPIFDAAVCIAKHSGAVAHNRDQGPAATALDEVIRPTAVTDAEGWAKFTHLLPGTYDLVAIPGNEKAARAPPWGHFLSGGPVPDSARCEGVSVRSEETCEYQVQIAPPLGPIPVVVRNADGTSIANKKLSFQQMRPNDDGGSSSGLDLDATGRGSFHPYTAGLWSIVLRHRDGPIKSFPVRDSPFYEATAVVAASPLLAGFPDIELTSGPIRPGSIRLQLRDAEGTPTRGYIVSGSVFSEPPMGGATDEHGTLVWHNLSEGHSSFLGYVPGMTALDADEKSPFAPDESLVGQKMVMRASASIRRGQETTLVLQPREVGYIRGRIRLPPGKKLSDYRPREPSSIGSTWDQYRTRYDVDTSEFLFGPLPLGKQTIGLLEERGEQTTLAYVVENVEVRDDRVTFVELTPPKTIDADQAVALAKFGVAPAPVPRDGRVFLPNKITPASDATIYVFHPRAPWPNSSSISDAKGRFTYDGLDPQGPGLPASAKQGERSSIVAVSPGTYARTIMPIPDGDDKRELRLVLGIPTRLRGRVTIGGEPATGIGNRLQVCIVRKEGSALDRYFDEEFNPSADGSFDRAGFAAGTYCLQAALDGIWLSTTRDVDVGFNPGDTQSIALDVGRPGAPSVLQCVDAAGKPAVGAIISLTRPDGPLTDRLWPRTFTADASGTLQLPPLEAGKHRFKSSTGSSSYELKVPPISTTGGKPYRQTIRLN